MVSEDHSRRRLIFLGDRSFEFEEGQEDGIGRRRVEIVERGQGLRRNIDLVGAEIKWVASQLLRLSRRVVNKVFLGRVSGGRRSVACWLRHGEEGNEVQVVVQLGDRRRQIFIPESSHGDGWEGVALVLEGFWGGNGWVSRGSANHIVKVRATMDGASGEVYW
ncbi:hypothetical protein LOK49_LG02G01749 [Camellia lanceoleosa]|uniref:Uncharacterized protein n=1 Tax=Camellia lanceoleosa TaxID=1840588 RepID=A0ACC0IL44_9ERIC|nr:hypothetical protein LOK49_LG02G01749 [Camellia lanceoleosa]